MGVCEGDEREGRARGALDTGRNIIAPLDRLPLVLPRPTQIHFSEPNTRDRPQTSTLTTNPYRAPVGEKSPGFVLCDVGDP